MYLLSENKEIKNTTRCFKQVLSSQQ